MRTHTQASFCPVCCTGEGAGTYPGAVGEMGRVCCPDPCQRKGGSSTPPRSDTGLSWELDPEIQPSLSLLHSTPEPTESECQSPSSQVTEVFVTTAVFYLRLLHVIPALREALAVSSAPPSSPHSSSLFCPFPFLFALLPWASEHVHVHTHTLTPFDCRKHEASLSG